MNLIVKYKAGLLAMVSAVPTITDLNEYLATVSASLGILYLIVKFYFEFIKSKKNG